MRMGGLYFGNSDNKMCCVSTFCRFRFIPSRRGPCISKGHKIRVTAATETATRQGFHREAAATTAEFEPQELAAEG